MSQDMFEMAKRIRMDLSAAQAKLTDLVAMISAANIPDTTRPTCSTCGLSFKHSLARDEHLYHAHDGPVPPAWVAAEELAESMSDKSLRKSPKSIGTETNNSVSLLEISVPRWNAIPGTCNRTGTAPSTSRGSSISTR